MVTAGAIQTPSNLRAAPKRRPKISLDRKGSLFFHLHSPLSQHKERLFAVFNLQASSMMDSIIASLVCRHEQRLSGIASTYASATILFLREVTSEKETGLGPIQRTERVRYKYNTGTGLTEECKSLRVIDEKLGLTKYTGWIRSICTTAYLPVTFSPKKAHAGNGVSVKAKNPIED